MRKKHITHIMLLDSYGGVRLNMGASRLLIFALCAFVCGGLLLALLGIRALPSWMSQDQRVAMHQEQAYYTNGLKEQHQLLVRHVDGKADDILKTAENIAENSVIGVPDTMTPLGPLASQTTYHPPAFAPAHAQNSVDTDHDLERSIERLSRFKKILGDVSMQLEQLASYIQEREGLLTSIPSIPPANGLLTSNFGRRKDPFTGRFTSHEGIDIAGQIGDPVYASADGIVSFSGQRGGYGNFIAIKHNDNMTTHYAHLHSRLVNAGEKVKRGDLIGRLGNSGRSTGPHLHYEILSKDVAINPMPYIIR